MAMPEHKPQSGTTLVELLITLVIVGIVAAAIYNLFRVHNLMAARQDETTRMQQELLSSVVQIADDLRMCGYDSEPNSGTKYGFNSTSNSTNVICTKDDSFSFNGTIIWYRFNDINNTIEYQNAAGNWVETATNVSNIVFAYFNNQGNSINATFPESIRAVDITVTAVASPERSLLNIGNRTLSTRVYCRNTGL